MWTTKIETDHTSRFVVTMVRDIPTNLTHSAKRLYKAICRKILIVHDTYLPNVHKILINDPQIISNALLPIGQLTEEIKEARNKNIKRYRGGHSRKCSRLNTNKDILYH